MNIRYQLLFASMTAATLLLTGCGGEYNKSSSPIDSNEDATIDYTLIAIGNYDSADSFAYREDYVLRDGSMKSTITSLLGTYEDLDYSADKTYYLAEDFSRVINKEDSDSIFAKNLEVISNDRFNIDLSYDDKSLVLQQTLDYVDISGYTSNTPNFHSVLNFFGLDDAVMPANSQCVIFANEAGDKAFYEVDIHNDQDPDYADDLTLEDWLAKQRLKDNYVSESEIEELGDENQYRGAYVNYSQTNNNTDIRYIIAVVEINGRLLDAYYYPEGGDKSNTDIHKGSIDCERFNDIAADYLEKEIKEKGIF